MTERWRKKLGDLDKHGPGDDVFERAKQGSMHAEDPIPHVATSRRIVTAVAAFAVFALAISVFAIPALRLNGTGAAGSSSGLFPLWPTQTPDDLQALQAQADAGQAEWALDPESVATRFARDVLGWDPVATGPAEEQSRECQVVWGGDLQVTASYGPGYREPTPSIATVVPCAAVSSVAPPWLQPSDFPSSTPTSSGGRGSFLTIALYRCSLNQSCLSSSQQSVTVYQPLAQGAGSIWAVFSAQSMWAHLSVMPGQNVRSGATVSGTFNDANPAVGFTSCDVGDGSSTYEDMKAGLHVSIDVGLEASAACEGAQRGYVWGAVGDPTLIGHDGTITRDPIGDGSSCGIDSCLEGITAYPVIMTFPELAPVAASAAATTDEPTVSPSAEPAWSTIKDVMGWKMSYPPDWTAALFGEKDKVGHAVYSGMQGPLTGAVVDVWTDPTAAGRPADDSSFPLDARAVIADGTFRADGILFHVDVTKDGASVSQLSSEEEPTVLRIVSSITFKPWSVGDRRGEWTSVGEVLPSTSAQWITYERMHYFTSYGPPRRLFGPKPDCPSGGQGSYEIRETGEATLTCPDGTTAAWDFTTGEALASNPAWCSTSLRKYEAVLSWDGQLLVRFPENSAGVGPLPSVSPSP